MKVALGELKWASVLVASLVYFLLGVPWFSPATLGPIWERSLGFVKPLGWEPGVSMYLLPLLACSVSTLATAILAKATRARTFADAAILGATVALGYSSAVAGVDAISPSHPDPTTLFLITGSYHLVGLTSAAIIVTRWSPGARS